MFGSADNGDTWCADGPRKFDKKSEARRGTLREDSYLDIGIPATRVRNPLTEQNTNEKRESKGEEGEKGKKRGLDVPRVRLCWNAGSNRSESRSKSKKVGGCLAALPRLWGAMTEWWDRRPSSSQSPSATLGGLLKQATGTRRREAMQQ